MKLKKKLEKLDKLSKNPGEDLPWEVVRAFPEIELCTTGISFHADGDYLSREEAIWALQYLLNELI